jgi:DNA-binding transcriptional LysR family regulator
MSYIENRLFQYFVAVVEERHFTKAAERLGITPPTLSHQIKKLQRDLGVKLVRIKGSQKVFITEAGQLFLADARETLRHAERAEARARQAGRGELGHIKLGFLTAASCAGLLESWIGAFEQAHQAIDITVDKLASTAQIAAIMRNELDAGFARMPRKYPSGVRGFEVYRQGMALALPSKHPLARLETISPEMLAEEAFVSFPTELDLNFSSPTEAIARLGNFVPRVVRRENDFIAVLTNVGLGRGIAVVPEIVKAMSFSKVVYRNIAADPMPRTSIAFVYGSDPSPSTKLLIRHMQRRGLQGQGGAAASPVDSSPKNGAPRLVFSREAS